MNVFCDKVKESAPYEERGEVLLPGELEYRTMETRRLEGIPLTPELLDTVKRLAGA